MEVGSGIEVLEEGKRTRVLMPESAPGRGSVDGWTVVLMGLLLALVVLQWLWMPGMSGPIKWWYGLGWLVIVLLFGKHAVAQGMLGRMAFKGRVELVVDRRGVRQRAWGPFYWWRVKLKDASVVVVCPPMPAWADRGERSDLATVRVSGRPAWCVWGAYKADVALEAALILQERIEGMRGVARVIEPAVAMRDEMGIARVEARAEEILESSNVVAGRGENGVRVELAAWEKKQPPGEDEPFLATANGWIFFVIGMAILVVGGSGGALISEELGGAQGVLNVVGLVVAFGSIVFGFAWILGASYVRVTYVIGGEGVERITRLYGMKWKRRWSLEEIEGMYLRQVQALGGAVWAVGIRKKDGKEVAFAQGWQRDARALAEVVERALGVNDKRGGSV